jgi:hypothetical protein
VTWSGCEYFYSPWTGCQSQDLSSPVSFGTHSHLGGVRKVGWMDYPKLQSEQSLPGFGLTTLRSWVQHSATRPRRSHKADVGKYTKYIVLAYTRPPDGLGEGASLWIWDLSDCVSFVEVNKETGKHCHVILFVRGYSFQQCFGGVLRHFDFSSIILRKYYFEPIDEGDPHQT